MNITVALARLSDERAQAQANRTGLIKAIGPTECSCLSRRLCASWVRAPWADREACHLATRCWSRFDQLRDMTSSCRAVCEIAAPGFTPGSDGAVALAIAGGEEGPAVWQAVFAQGAIEHQLVAGGLDQRRHGVQFVEQ